MTAFLLTATMALIIGQVKSVFAQTESSDATLSALTLSGLVLEHDSTYSSPGFHSAVVDYTASAPLSLAGTTVTPTVNHSGASHVIRLNGVTDSDGTLSLPSCSNVITVEVTAEDQATTQTYTVTVTRSQEDTWLCPTPSDPAVADSTANYTVTFQGDWTTSATPGGLPGSAHFSRLVGAVHNADVTFLRSGELASSGIESMAEIGGTSTLKSEVRAEISGTTGNALSVLEGDTDFISPTAAKSLDITVTTDHPRVTLVTMIAPSPDWFVGVSGLSLLDSNGNWLSSLEVELYPWDAGTENGDQFSLSNPATSPQGVITSLYDSGKFSTESIASLTFTRKSGNNDATGTPTFVGAFRVGEVLRIDTSSIQDLDGLTNPDFSFTWLADDDLNELGAYLRALSRVNQYEIPPYDFGMTIKVQVHFDDDLGNGEVIHMQAATTVAAAPPDQPGSLSASLGDPGELDLRWAAPEYCDFDCWQDNDRSVRVGDGGSDITGYTVQWKLSSADWDTASDVSEAEVTDTSYTVTGLTSTNSYTVRVRAKNVAGLGTPSTEVTVSGTDLNVGPVVSGRALPYFFELNPRDVTTYTATDPESDTITWSLSGDDASFFSIANGVLNFDSAGDFEDPQDAGANNAYDLNILASDGQNTATFPITVVIFNVEDEPPVIAGDDALMFAEYTEATTVLQTYSATDPEGANSSFTWSLYGTDSGDFEISDAGALTFKNVPDYDSPADSDGDNVYDVQVRATDATKTGRLNVTVTVTNVNEAPTTPTGKDAITVPENTAGNLAQYSATEPDKDDTVIWGVSGTDADAFRIDSSGNLAFDGAPDFDNPTDDGGNNVYEVSVDAKDAEFTSSLAVTVTVTPVDEPPVITGVTTINDYDENGTGNVATYTAVDPEGDSNLTWSLGGTDRGDFDITGGVLTFKSTPDYERPADSGGNNHYEVTIESTDSNSKKGTLHVDVIVRNVDEMPVITGPDTVDDFPENSATSRQVGRYTASDPEGATVALSLTGTDSDEFTLASNGALTFDESPDYEDESSYSVTVRAVAGSHTVNKVVTVNIQNVEEPGTITLSSVQPQEGTVFSATLDDDDGAIGTTWQWYRASSRGSTGTAITNATSSTYTPDTDDVGSYLRIVASYDDGHGAGKSAATVSANRALAVNPDNVRPVFPADGDYARSIRENTREGANLGAPVRATDANNDRLTYSIPSSDYFEINAATGQLRTKVVLDHELSSTRTIEVTAADPGNLTVSVTVTITIEDVDETPVMSGPSSLEFAEDTGTGTTLATYASTDPDSKGIELVLSGADSEDLRLSGGVLTFSEVPDFEAPADANRDNRYQVTVEAQEQGDGTSVGRLNVTIRVTNVDEPGVVEANVEEPRVGQMLRLNVEDQDGGESVREWKWEKGEPNSPCGTVDSSTVTTWETIGEARGSSYTPSAADQGHCIRVTAFYNDRAGTGRTEQFLTPNSVEVGPFFSQDPPTYRVRENTAEGRNVGRVQARHSNSGETLTYRLSGADVTYFTIDDGGQLRTSAIPMDYETQPGTEATVEVTAEDNNGQTATTTVTVTVIDECTSAGEPPCAPGRPSVSSASDTSLRITWPVPSTPSGASLTGYELQYRGTDGGGSWIPRSVAGTDRSHTIENLVKGSSYEVQVRAQNGNGNGGWSQSGTGTPGVVAPPPSTGGGGGGFGPAPVAPKFADGFRTQRELPANARPEDPIGDPIDATHPDDLDITYSLSGIDAAHFTVDEETGQLRVKDGMTPVVGNTYTVNLTATDSAGIGVIIIVVIEVTKAAHHPYDADGSGTIERDEVVTAVKDYFDGLITKDDVIELVKLYFAESG